MDINELQKYLEKIDFNALNKAKGNLSEDDAYIGELFNSSIDNIKQHNIDVARIKLSRVVKLDPTFEKAKLLLEKINSLESDKSLGDKMEDALLNKEEKEKKVIRQPSPTKKPSEPLEYKPSNQQKTTKTKTKTFSVVGKGRKITPFAFIKTQMIIIIALVVVILILIAIILGMRKKFANYVAEQPDLKLTIQEMEVEKQNQSVITQSAIEKYIRKIEEYQNRLTTSDSDIATSQQEAEKFEQQNFLYRGKYLSVMQKYPDALASLLDIDIEKANFSESDMNLYNETIDECKKNISISLYQSGNKLYQDFKYKEAFENFNKIWNYYPDYQSVKQWDNDKLYSNLVYDSVYKMSKCAFETGNYIIAIDGYKFLEDSQSEFAKTNRDGLIYHSAKAYAGTEDYIKAEELFKKVIKEHPTSELVVYAKERLAAVQIKLGK